TSGISAMIGKRGGKPLFALGLPGAHRIPSCVLQAVLNMVDHGMSVQEAVEAPRVFSWGQEAEVERGFGEPVRAALAERGHDVAPVDHVGGGMCAIGFGDDGSMTGAACWRADGSPAGIGGGLARRNPPLRPGPPRKRERGPTAAAPRCRT